MIRISQLYNNCRFCLNIFYLYLQIVTNEILNELMYLLAYINL